MRSFVLSAPKSCDHIKADANDAERPLPQCRRFRSDSMAGVELGDIVHDEWVLVRTPRWRASG
jgi:hypothetical protein